MRFWNWVTGIGTSLQSPLLLVIRLYWGYQFAVGGFGKFSNLDTVAGYFESLSIPLPYINAILAASAEFFGGILLFLGLFSRLAALPLLGVMAVAYLTAGHDALVALFTQFDPEPFFHDSAFLFTYATLIVFCFGPGSYSCDRWILTK